MVVGPVIHSIGDLLCPLMLEWGMIAPMLQCDAQHVGCANISVRHIT